MCCGGGDAPNSPDPYATANAQKDAYIQSATANAYLNRMDETTPFGSVHYETMPDDASSGGTPPGTPGPNADWFKIDPNTGAYQFDTAAMSQGPQAQLPWGGVPRMRKVTSLNPDEQAILDQSRGNKIRLGEMAGNKIGEVEAAFGTPFSFDGAPGAGNGVLKRLQAMAERGGPKLDEAARQQVQDALYRRQTAELDPRFKQEQIALETQLANQGIARGSQAWNKATNQFSRQKNTTYGDALDRAITGGGAEQSRLFGLKSARRAQNLGALQNLYGLKQTGRQNWLKEAMAKRQMPMEELNMLLGKSEGYNVPQFKNASDINVQSPDLQGLIGDDYKNKYAAWKGSQERDDAATGAALSTAATAAAAFSW